MVINQTILQLLDCFLRKLLRLHLHEAVASGLLSVGPADNLHCLEGDLRCFEESLQLFLPRLKVKILNKNLALLSVLNILSLRLSIRF
jgi:hypothetical protein